jgi:hypothetical protein
MIPPDQFLRHVIRPALGAMAEVDARYNHPTAERLLIGTSIKESGLVHLEQKAHADGRKGPAVSMFQIEPFTFNDVWERRVKPNDKLRHAVLSFCFVGIPLLKQLPGNQHLACAIARLKYFDAPAALPAPTDVNGMAMYWGRYYQTQSVRAQMLDWAAKYREHTAGIWK